MPIPTPNEDEEQDAFISRCMNAVKEADPDREKDQIAAMCYSQWRESKKDQTTTGPIGALVASLGADVAGQRSEEERAKAHFKIDDETWNGLSEAEKQAYIDGLPPRGTGDVLSQTYEEKIKGTKILHVESFKWNPESLTIESCEACPAKFQSFQWLPQIQKPDWAHGRLYTFSTLESPITVNGQRFDDAQKNRCAASIVGAPVSLNHEVYDLAGQNIVLDADVEDGRMEGLCYIEDPHLNELYDTNMVAGCSIEYFDRPVAANEFGITDVKGVLCIGLTFVTQDRLDKGFVLGDPKSCVGLLTLTRDRVDRIEEALSSQTGSIGEIMKMMTLVLDGFASLQEKLSSEKPEIPDAAFAFVGDGERKLQVMTVEGKYSPSLLSKATDDFVRDPDNYPPAKHDEIKKSISDGFKALLLPVPEALLPETLSLEDRLDPRLKAKINRDIERRRKYQERFRFDRRGEPY